MPANTKPIVTTIAPWLTVPAGASATDFYKQAFAADEMYRLETPDGLIVKLSVAGAEFWLSEGRIDRATAIGGNTVRMILTVADPEYFFARAIAAGAKEVFPVSEEHGWKLGRVVDPFGLHWEIGHPLAE